MFVFQFLNTTAGHAERMSRLLDDFDYQEYDVNEDDYDDYDEEDDVDREAPASRLTNLADLIANSTTLSTNATSITSPPTSTTSTKVDSERAAVMLRERQEWRSKCRELQISELERLRELYLPSNRVEIGDLNDAGRVVVLRGRADDAFGWSVRAVLTPMHPLREVAMLKLSLRDDASDDALVKWRVAVTRARIERTMRQVVSERAGQTVLVELVVAIDDALVNFAPIQPQDGLVKLPLINNADAAAADEVDFVGSWVQSYDFAMPVPEFDVSDGATATLVGTRVFVIGGFADSDRVPTVRIFDLASRTWSVPPKKHRNLHMGGHCTVRVGDSLYNFGGVVNRNYEQAVAIFHTKTMTWSFANAPFTPDLRWLTGTRVGDDIFLIGGTSSAANMTGSGLGRHIYVFNTKFHTFREFQCSVCAAGGERCPACEERISSPLHNAATAMYDRLGSFPMLSHHTTTLVGDWLVIHGGLFDCEVSARTLCLNWRDFYVCELPMCDIVRPRSQHVAARISERFVAFFGGRAASDVVTQIDIFDLYRQEWHARTPQSNLVARFGGAALALHSGEILLLFGHVSIEDTRNRYYMTHFSTAMHCLVHQPRPPLLLDLGLPRPTPPSQLALTLTQVLETGEYSDVSCRSLRLHRVVLAARCPRLLELIDESHRDLGDISDTALGAVVKSLYADVPLAGVSDAEQRALSAVLRWDHANAEPLQRALAAFFDNDELRERTADLSFVCASGEDGGGDVRLGVHRLFVNRLEHFRAILAAGMIESVTGEIRVAESAECMRAALRFFYCEMLDAASAEQGVELLSFADRVGAKVLKQHTERMIESFYDFSDLSNVVDLVDIAERSTAPHLLRRSLNVLHSEFGNKEVLDFINGNSVSAAVSKSALELIRKTLQPSGVALLHQ